MKMLAERAYELLLTVPAGRVTTYKALAEALGTRAYRAVGQAMARNPYDEVPCHRVVESDGKIGGYRGRKSGEAIAEKKVRLREEGVEILGDKIKGFEKVMFRF